MMFAPFKTKHYRVLFATAAIVGTLLAVPSAQAAPTCFGQEATIVGTNGSDSLQGEPDKADVIVAKAGEDQADAFGRNDRVCMGGGADTFGGAAGDEAGDDRIDMGPGDDSTARAESGDDVLLGGDGGDGALEGGAGDDVVDGGTGGDGSLYGDSQATSADAGRDQVIGGPGDDSGLLGGPLGDVLRGGDGNDGFAMIGGGGRDLVLAGPGDDCSPVATLPDMQGGEGNDVVDGGDGSDCRLYGDAGDDELLGGAGNDTEIEDHSGADELFGGDGDDELDAQDGVGDDTLRGGPMTDTCAYDIILGGGEDDVASCEL
jgi:Ca2+-binding RTX toxin-like protein